MANWRRRTRDTPSGILSEITPRGEAIPLPADLTPYHRAGQGSPLVLLHGFTMSWRAWLPIIPFVSAHHTVLAMTLPGHRGGPPLVAGAPPGAPALADLLCDEFDKLGLDSAHLVGNSLGGWTSLELARRGRARSVVGISPGGSWASRRDIQMLLWKFRVLLPTLTSERLRPMLLSPAGRRAWLSRMARHPERIPAGHVLSMVEDMLGCELVPLLLAAGRTIEPLAPLDIANCPIRIAWAEYDKVISYRRFGRPMQELIPGAEFITLPKVGHVPMYDDPRLVARTILEVTREVDAAAQEHRQPRRAAKPPAGRARTA